MTLKQARIKAGITQRQASERINKTVMTLQRYESGKTDMNAKDFMTLCKFYGVSPNDITLLYSEGE